MRIEVKCNGQLNPKGMDFGDLRFCVQTEGVPFIKGVEYEFYRSERDADEGNFFRLEKSEGGHLRVAFDGFSCGETFFYRATALTGEGKQYSDLHSVEAGLVKEDIVGKWIDNGRFDGRVAEFLKEFEVEDEVVSARLYIVGLGFYDSDINGTPTDSYYFKPLLTDFDIRRELPNNRWYDWKNFINGKKTVSYDTYDVTDLIKKGKNELRVLLGTGWYCNTDKDFTDPSFTFGTPKLFFELHIKSRAGETVVKSDESCLVRNTARSSQMFAGDFADFTKEAESYEFASLCASPSGTLVPTTAEQDAILETLTPLKTEQRGNKTLYDFGKNHTGGLKIKVRGKRGAKLIIKYYETLKNGEPNPHSSRWVAYLDGKEPIGYLDQKGEYVLSGDIDEISPLFHWNCYRYAEIETTEPIEILSLESLFISADITLDGRFNCSEKILNDLFNAFVLTQRDNIHCGVPSDCPHREKLPYTGDGQLVAESVSYIFAAEEFYRKWLKDIIAAQGEDGWVPYTAPYISGGGGYWWCNALTALPLTIYKFSGDKSVLKDALAPSLKLIDFYQSMHEGDFIIRKTRTKWLLGDWLAPDEIGSNISYVNTLAFYSAVSQVKESCLFLGESETAQKLEFLLQKIKQAVNEQFFDKEKFCYGNGVQGEDVLPLLFGFTEGETAEKLCKKTIAHYRETGRFDTGIVFTPALLEILVKFNAADVAMQLLLAREYPSFAWMLEGETTLCEHWSKYWPKTRSGEDAQAEENLGGDVSHCHPMYGSVVAWLYKHVAGLDLSRIYERKILFAPKCTREIYTAYASKKTRYGTASIEYDASRGIKMRIQVPEGVEGEVRLPLTVCERFYACGGQQIKSRKREDYSYVKLTGGEWLISSDISFVCI